MMSSELKFSANLSTMFAEVPFLERFHEAEKIGFKYVEIQNPYSFEPDLLKEKKGGLNCDLVNIYCDSAFGCASIPVHDAEFYTATQRVIPYHNALNFKKLHILSGEISSRFTKEDHFSTLVESLKTLVSSDFLENINVTGLIEPICSDVNEKYFLNSFETAVEVIKAVNSDQIKLLLDVYHLHKITNDVHKYLEIYYPYAGHIQVSQDPGRTEPFCKGGKIDYTFVFDYLRQKKHPDPIGLEYYPSGSTADSLDWMKNY